MARIVVIAPGRGSYNRTELSYLNRFNGHPNHGKRLYIREQADQFRQRSGRLPISELDQASSYKPSLHLPGEHASALIYTCAAADYAMISEEHDVVATLGNSMGWYITLFTSGILSFEQAFHVVDTMGNFQKGHVQGGQIIYPVIDDQWRHDPEREQAVQDALDRVRALGEDFWAGLSIRLGGQRVLAGTASAVKAMLNELPKVQMGANEYPFQLARHAAFHTPIMRDLSEYGHAHLGDIDWGQPKIPCIDGRGHIWRPYQTVPEMLRDYTLSHQVVAPFDFSCSVRVALREYNPDHLVLLGPGETLGGAIAQVIISEGWRGIHSKQDFIEAQKSDHPPLISMNRPDQAERLI